VKAAKNRKKDDEEDDEEMDMSDEETPSKAVAAKKRKKADSDKLRVSMYKKNLISTGTGIRVLITLLVLV